MTPISIPLRSTSMCFKPLQQSSSQAEEPGALDPTLDGESALLLRDMLLDGEPEIGHLDRAASFWTGIHWYRELHDRHRIETG